MTSSILDKSRLIVTKFLQTPFATALNSIDQIYFIVGYAALTICDFNIADPLVHQIQTFLAHLAPTEDHIAYRFSCIIADFKHRYPDHSIPSTAPIKRDPFADSSPSALGTLDPSQPQPHIVPPLMNMDGYGSLDQFVPDFMPSYPLSGAVFQSVPMDMGMGGLVQQHNG